MGATIPNFQPRPTPDRYTQIKGVWFHWRSVWNAVHYTLGSLSAFSATLVAANAGAVAAGSAIPGAKGFMPPIAAAFVAGAAAVLTFLLTVSKPAEKAKCFEAAARYMEGKIALYESGGNVNLGIAYDEALRLLC